MFRKSFSGIAIVAAILLSVQPAMAELFSISAGVPLSHSFSGTDSSGNAYESDGVSGFFMHAKLPILVGVGVESYETKYKDSTMTLGTTMYDIFYVLPIPFINLTLGLGAGQTELSNTGSSSYDTGSATQWYTSLGFPFIGIMDVHLSYRNVTSKIPGLSGTAEMDASGTVTGVGVSIGF